VREEKLFGALSVRLFNQLKFPLYAASPRHKSFAQMLQLWALRFNRAAAELYYFIQQIF